ncbi:MAG: HAD family phosphatase [Cyanobacteria bacterium SID2]|nr:HAD family phosphatase [Cyanobacteria bacterium SID2]MBP0002990.1 HAD family phosphatase [Cyanobacteria bacterium SBC]
MPFLVLSGAIEDRFAAHIGLVATDMDGTMTQAGKFTSGLLTALERFADAEIAVLVVTGRSAGWVSGLAHYLPIVGAIAENGGLFYSPSDEMPMSLVSIDDFQQHRQDLATTFRALQSAFPQVRESADNRFRLTDWTFDVAGLFPETLEQIALWCEERDWSLTYSSVQCHLKLPEQDKARGLLKVLAARFPHLSPNEIATVGDSPNDGSLFDASIFPHSVGVANVLEYRDRLPHLPKYVTPSPEGAGFCELADYIRSNR